MLDDASFRNLPIQIGCYARDEVGDRSGLIARLSPPDRPTDAALQCHDGRTVWVRIADLRSAFHPDLEVLHLPNHRRSLGEGRIVATRTIADRDQCAVLCFSDGMTRWLPFETLAYCADVPLRAAQGDVGVHPDHAERFRLRALAAMLQSWNAATGAFGRLDVDPLPHQIRVAKRVVGSSEKGWVIADDVGLGKTIELGLILHALRQGGRARRALIVCPSSLVRQWKMEMRLRFGQSFVIYGRDVMPETADDLAVHDGVIVSMDLAKREDHMALLCDRSWDMIAVDEAHRLGMAEDGTRTGRYRLAEALRARTELMILLTATPHQGKTRRFSALLDLARPDLSDRFALLEADPDIVREVIIRNPKTRVTDAAGNLLFRGHDTRRVEAKPSPEGKAFDAALQAYLRHGYAAASRTEGGVGQAIGFVMTTYRKLASSSLAAIERALARRRDRLLDDATVEDVAERLEAGTLSEDDLADTDMIDSPSFFDDEPEKIAELLKLARQARDTDAKGDLFLREILAPLERVGETLLIFTEYRATQDWLVAQCQKRLGSGAIAMIHGGLDVDARMAEVERFNTGEAQIMISTEAGGEGLNLHHNCHVMVNYDLPWNPSRLVQRIGRLYRYGQTKRVQVINLSVDDGFDAQALNLMLDRVMTMARELAPVGVPNAEGLASEILGELLAQIDMEDLLSRATGLQIERTREEVEEALRLAREARLQESEILSFAETDEIGPTTDLDHRHLVALVEGMASHLGIDVRNVDRKGGRIDITLPDDLVGRLSGYGRAANITLVAPRSSGIRLKNAYPLDLDASLLRHIVRAARTRAFDGMFSITNDLSASAIGLVRLRGVDDLGAPMTERIALIGRGADGSWHEMKGDTASNFLLSKLHSTLPIAETAILADEASNQAVLMLRADCTVARCHPLFWRLDALASGSLS